MKIAVLYESFYGNTEQIARAIAEEFQAELWRIDGVNQFPLNEVTLLICGSPTRAFHESEGMGKWLKRLPKDALEGKQVVAFDTRMDVRKHPSKTLRFMAGHFGYAAAKIQRRLIAKGGEEISEPSWFIVDGMEGPLQEGELERAKLWAKGLLH